MIFIKEKIKGVEALNVHIPAHTDRDVYNLYPPPKAIIKPAVKQKRPNRRIASKLIAFAPGKH
jgi:hypothetical protein